MRRKDADRNCTSSPREGKNVFSESLRGVGPNAPINSLSQSSGTTKLFFDRLKHPRKMLSRETYQPPTPVIREESKPAFIRQAMHNGFFNETVHSSNARMKDSLRVKFPASNSSLNIHSNTRDNDTKRFYNFQYNEITQNDYLMEVDFVINLCNILILGKDTLFSQDSLDNFSLPSHYKLEENFEKRVGQDCIRDLLARCSNYRRKFCAIEQFINDFEEERQFSSSYGATLNNNNSSDVLLENNKACFNQPPLSTMLIRPLCIVLQQFLDSAKAIINKAKVHCRDVTDFSDLFVRIEGEMEKVYKFFLPLLRSTEKVNLIWYKFVEELNTSADLDEDLPNGQKLYTQLVPVLGEYFDLLCQNPIYLDKLVNTSISTKSCSTNSLGNNDTIGRWTRGSGGTRGSSLEDISGITVGYNNNSINLMTGSYHGGCVTSLKDDVFPFVRLCTERVIDNLISAARFSEKLRAGSGVFLQARSFSKIYNEVSKKIAEQESTRSPFNFFIALLEQTSMFYKEQFTDFIYQRIHEGHKLEICLYQIKELYTLKLFASHMAASSRELDTKDYYNLFDWQGRLDGALADHIRNTQVLARRFSASRRRLNPMLQNNNNNNDIDNDNDGGEHTELGFVAATALTDNLPNPNEWRIKISEYLPPWNFKLSCDLEWPLCCVLGKDLFDALDNCLDKCQLLFVLHKFVLVLTERSSSLGLVTANLLSRRKRLLARKLLEIVTVLYQSIRDHLESIIEKHSAQILKARSVEKIDDFVRQLTNDLQSLLEYNGDYIHTTINALHKIIDEFYEMETNQQRISPLTPTQDDSANNTSLFKQQIPCFSDSSRQSQLRRLSRLSSRRSSDRKGSHSTSNITDSANCTPINKSSSYVFMEKNENAAVNTSALAQVDSSRQMQKVGQRLINTSTVRSMLDAATKLPNTSIDTNSLSYSIAFQLNPNPNPN